MRPYRLSQGRFSILLSIGNAPNSRLSGNELSSQLGVSKATISKMIKRLSEEGYLICGTNRVDLRKKQYTLTGKANALLEKIIPGYLQRLRLMLLNIKNTEKETLHKVLSKINFLDSHKTLIPIEGKTITEKSHRIMTLCKSGSKEDINRVMEYLNQDTDLPTTKIVDFYLGTVSNIEGLRQVEHYLFNGSQIQRNYCTLFFARRNEWQIVNRAYNLGLIDYAQAYSR